MSGKMVFPVAIFCVRRFKKGVQFAWAKYQTPENVLKYPSKCTKTAPKCTQKPPKCTQRPPENVLKNSSKSNEKPPAKSPLIYTKKSTGGFFPYKTGGFAVHFRVGFFWYKTGVF